MLINKQIKNVLYTYDRFSAQQTHNVFYNRASSLFDAAIQQFPNDKLNLIDMAHNDSLMSQLRYSAIWINDILNYSQHIPQFAEFYTGEMLFIHDPPNTAFKKEDLSILRTNLNRYRFLSFCAIDEVWPFDHIAYVPYGVLPYSEEHKNKVKDIIVLNFKRQRQINILYQYIKQVHPNTDIMESQIDSIDNAQKLISQYKVCIDFDNYYNLLVANTCNTIGISSLYSVDNNIYRVENSQEMFKLLPQLLGSTITSDISKEVVDKYNWNKFCDNIYAYFIDIFNRGLII